MAEQAYRVTTGAIGDFTQGAVVRESDFAHLPPGRFQELVERGGVFEKLSDKEARALETGLANDRTGGEVEDQFADQSRADFLEKEARLREWEGERAADRQERSEMQRRIKELEDRQAELLERLETRQASQQAATATGTAPAKGGTK